jgi:hypothetical protein
MKWLKRIFFIIFFLIALVLAWAFKNGMDRFPNYSLSLDIKPSEPTSLKVGFAAFPITPLIEDTWTDIDSNAYYDPKAGDTFQDKNNNGKFDAYWLAGFQNMRPANGVHDDIWARAMVIDDGKTRLAMVGIDLIGFGHDDVIAVRNMLPQDINISYSIMCASHTHEAPDFIGLWGEEYKHAINQEFKKNVYAQTARAITEAVKKLRPSKLKFAIDETNARAMVKDTRKPNVFDNAVKIMQAIDTEADTTLGTLVVWGNHPETTWNKNLLITSDFVHYWREGVEKGVYQGDSLIMKGLGGTTVFINGAIGGLMTTPPELAVKDPFSEKRYEQPSFSKAEAQGKTLAMITLNALKDSINSEIIDKTSIALRANTFEIPLDNSLYRLAVGLGVLDRGYSSWGKMRTEIAVIRIGSAIFLTTPGEIYPEIIYGGIEAPPGQDFALQPQEIPPLITLMKGKYRFILGLANDEIGYIIPQSEWDTEPPYLYGAKEQLYGEINSIGSKTASVIHSQSKKLLEGF